MLVKNVDDHAAAGFLTKVIGTFADGGQKLVGSAILPELIEVIQLARAGHLRAHIEEFSLADAPRAYQAMRLAIVQLNTASVG